MTQLSPMPMLEKRRIEAEIIKEIYDVLVEKTGKELAQEVIGEAVRKSAIAQGREFRDTLDHTPDLQDFARLSDLWEMGGALKKEMLHESADRLEYNMTHCAYARMYREMGLAEIGHLLSCNRDGSFCIGYNPDMKLTRTQTIMEGASHCDFRYRLEKS